MAANPQTKQNDLGCESAENWQLSSTSTIAIVIVTQPVGWYSFYRPTKGGRLSRPKHCSKGAQPVLKSVYRSSRRDKTQLSAAWFEPGSSLTAVRRANHSATGTCNAGKDITYITYSFIANCQTAVVHKNKTKRWSKIYNSQYIFRYNILTVKLQSVIREMRSGNCLCYS